MSATSQPTATGRRKPPPGSPSAQQAAADRLAGAIHRPAPKKAARPRAVKPAPVELPPVAAGAVTPQVAIQPGVMAKAAPHAPQIGMEGRAPTDQWDPRPKLRELERTSRTATTAEAIFDHLTALDVLQRPDETRAPWTAPGEDDGAHDRWMDRWCAVERRMKRAIIALPGLLPPRIAAGVLNFVIEDQERGTEAFASDHLTWRMARRVAHDLKMMEGTAGQKGLDPGADAELIRICDGHAALIDAVNAGPDEPEDGPIWQAYARSRDAIAGALPATIAGLLAKARAAKAEARGSAGEPENHLNTPAENWSWDLVNDMFRMFRLMPALTLPATPVENIATVESLSSIEFTPYPGSILEAVHDGAAWNAAWAERLITVQIAFGVLQHDRDELRRIARSEPQALAEGMTAIEDVREYAFALAAMLQCAKIRMLSGAAWCALNVPGYPVADMEGDLIGAINSLRPEAPAHG